MMNSTDFRALNLTKLIRNKMAVVKDSYGNTFMRRIDTAKIRVWDDGTHSIYVNTMHHRNIPSRTYCLVRIAGNEDLTDEMKSAVNLDVLEGVI